MSKKIIAVIAGGDSSEYVVSLKSAENIFNSIDTTIYQPFLVRIRHGEWVVIENEKAITKVSKEDFSFVYNNLKIVPDLAFIMVHGTPGEDGKLQAYFDMIKIPYSTCGVYTSALTFHKFYCDNFLRSFDVPMADSLYFQKGDEVVSEVVIEKFGLPVFVKPSAGGSSFGVTKVKSADELIKATEHAYAESGDCLIEEFVDGMELAVGVCELNGEVVPFLPTEVIPSGEFFDFDSKYEIGGATEITPARLPKEQIEECQSLAARIYKLLDCKGIVRVDFILRDGVFNFLEINTIPGMTATSFIPQQLNAMGMELTEVLNSVIEQQLEKLG